MHLIEDMSQIQISTIHKFAISLLHKECMRMGIGFDSQISSETYDRRQLYHSKLDTYLSEKTEENPDFVHQLTIPSFEIESMLLNFCDQLYNRSIDIKEVDVSSMGNAIGSIPYFNELVEKVVIPAEILYPYNKVYLANFIESNYVPMKIKHSELKGHSADQKLNELVRILDEYFMLLLGKKWNEIIADFEARPVLVVLREIYEKARPWMTYSSKQDLQLDYRTNYECLLEKITQKYSREYLTINIIGEFLKINITTYQEEASRKKETDSNDVTVICTTIHKSKGLEYGTVVIPYTADDISSTYHSGISVNVVDGKLIYSYGAGKGNMDYCL